MVDSNSLEAWLSVAHTDRRWMTRGAAADLAVTGASVLRDLFKSDQAGLTVEESLDLI